MGYCYLVPIMKMFIVQHKYLPRLNNLFSRDFSSTAWEVKKNNLNSKEKGFLKSIFFSQLKVS